MVSIGKVWRKMVVAVYRALPQSLSHLVVYWIKPKYVIGVVALVSNDAGRLLVLHHTYGRRYTWRFPGGVKERHEHPYLTVERELREEANIQARAIKVLGVFETPTTFDVAVLCEAVDIQPFRRNEEVDDCRWIDPVQHSEVKLPSEQELMIKMWREMMR